MTALAEAVARGAALLDARNPGWYLRLNPKFLLLSDPERCVLGQLYGWYSVGLTTLALTAHDNEATHHGFCITNDDDEPGWRELERLWRREIRQRAAATLKEELRAR